VCWVVLCVWIGCTVVRYCMLGCVVCVDGLSCVRYSNFGGVVCVDWL